MSYSPADLTNEIRRVINDGLDGDRAQPASWIAKALLNLHPFPPHWAGDHRDFAALCCASHVRNEVRQALREYKTEAEKDGEGPREPTLPGFKHLRRAYLIQRGGEQHVVPIGQMGLGELDEKIIELEAMSKGCLAHANELRRYRNDRATAA
jgi:hypothetical protein